MISLINQSHLQREVLRVNNQKLTKSKSKTCLHHLFPVERLMKTVNFNLVSNSHLRNKEVTHNKIMIKTWLTLILKLRKEIKIIYLIKILSRIWRLKRSRRMILWQKSCISRQTKNLNQRWKRDNLCTKVLSLRYRIDKSLIRRRG